MARAVLLGAYTTMVWEYRNRGIAMHDMCQMSDRPNHDVICDAESLTGYWERFVDDERVSESWRREGIADLSVVIARLVKAIAS